MEEEACAEEELKVLALEACLEVELVFQHSCREVAFKVGHEVEEDQLEALAFPFQLLLEVHQVLAELLPSKEALVLPLVLLL